MPDPQQLSVACGEALTSRRRMSVRMRLARVGAKKNPIWSVVVADQRSPRDGRTIETIGQYNPQTDPSLIVIDEDRARALAREGRPAHAHRGDPSAHPGNSGDRPLGAADRCASYSTSWPARWSRTPIGSR